MALTSIFLKLYLNNRMVKGESQARGYEGQIEVESFNWAVVSKLHREEGSQNSSVEVGARNVKFTKVWDAASGILLSAAGKVDAIDRKRERARFTTARFTMASMINVDDTTRDLGKMVELVLSDGEIEDVSLSTTDNKDSIGIKEEVTLSYRKVQLLYHPLDRGTGRRGGAMTFDLVPNEPSSG